MRIVTQNSMIPLGNDKWGSPMIYSSSIHHPSTPFYQKIVQKVHFILPLKNTEATFSISPMSALLTHDFNLVLMACHHIPQHHHEN